MKYSNEINVKIISQSSSKEEFIFNMVQKLEFKIKLLIEKDTFLATFNQNLQNLFQKALVRLKHSWDQFYVIFFFSNISVFERVPIVTCKALLGTHFGFIFY